MRSGRLRETVEFRRPKVVINPGGAESITYHPYCCDRASIEPMRSNELLQSMQVNSEVTTKIVTRWTPQLSLVDYSFIIAHKNPLTGKYVLYEIHGEPIEVGLRHRELNFMCKSLKNKEGTEYGHQ